MDLPGAQPCTRDRVGGEKGGGMEGKEDGDSMIWVGQSCTSNMDTSRADQVGQIFHVSHRLLQGRHWSALSDRATLTFIAVIYCWSISASSICHNVFAWSVKNRCIIFLLAHGMEILCACLLAWVSSRSR